MMKSLEEILQMAHQTDYLLIRKGALEEVSEDLRPWIKYSNMLVPAFAVVVFGLVRWRRRKSREFIVVGGRDR